MSRRTRLGLALATGFAVFAGLVVLASLPTGADRPEDVVPDGARLAGRSEVDDAVVLLLSRSGVLEVQVAYEGPKGWLGVPLEPDDARATTNRATVASRVSTAGGGPVPALTAAFGTAGTADAAVTVTWADGRSDHVEVGADGSWLIVRPKVSEVSSVVVTRGDDVLARVGRL